MLIIIADDLTGALDSAGPFAGRGLSTQVVLNVDALPAVVKAKPDVISICLSSRRVSASSARQITRRIVSMLPESTLIFKKIDSRLQGNIAAELDETPYTRSLIAPGIPEFGRIVRAGSISGFGVGAPISIAGALGSHASRGTIPDTVCREDMFDIVQHARGRNADLYIGARGLADALARKVSGIEHQVPAKIPSGGTLFVIGSRDRITVKQVEVLRRDCLVGYLPARNGIISATRLSRHPVTIVQAVPGGISSNSSQVTRNLAHTVVPTLTRSVETLFLSGGETAESILQEMGVSQMRVVGEVLPGIVMAHAEGYNILTKSGGFGEPETLRDIASQILRIST